MKKTVKLKNIENNFEIDKHHSEEWFLDKLRYLMEESIFFCRADVPSFTISGGIDSTLISILSIEKRKQIFLKLMLEDI